MLFFAVGRIVISWAYVEMAIDQCVTLVYRKCGGKSIESPAPKLLKRKCDFLKRAFKKIPELDAFKDEALALITKVLDIAEQRHEIHGAFFGIDNKTGAFMFLKYDHGPTDYALRPFYRDYSQLEKRGTKMLDLAGEFGGFANRLSKHFAK